MYTMKEACDMTGVTYETLKFYCNEGLVPNVKRDSRNRRVFDEYDIAWLKSLLCLRKCGMSHASMKEYLKLCLAGEGSIPERKELLLRQKKELHERIRELDESVAYIDRKLRLYDDMLAGRVEYHSNLIRPRGAQEDAPLDGEASDSSMGAES